MRTVQFSAGVILRANGIHYSVNMVLSSKNHLGPFLIPCNGFLFFRISWLEMCMPLDFYEAQ